MNIIIPKFSLNARVRAALWAMLAGTWIGKHVCHEGQLGLASDLVKLQAPWRNDFAEKLFGLQLKGAGYGWESRRNLTPVVQTAIATTGANSTVFNITDLFEIAVVGFWWTVTGTITIMDMTFNLHPQLAAAGSAVAKLDGTNGLLSGYAVGDQTAGKLWYNDIADTKSPVTATPGQSVAALVGTTTTAGNGLPLVIGWSKSETFRNISSAVRMPNT